jgi:Leucine-rich repeat (LRR) protein
MDGAAAGKGSASRQASISSAQSSANSWDGTIASRPSTTTSNEADAEPTHRKSSAALRGQIARAKAAKRAAAAKRGVGVSSTAEVPVASFASQEEPLIPVDDGFDFGVEHDDPFNARKGEDPKKRVLNQRVRAARTTGRLNIAALNLTDMPSEVMKMYDLDNVGGNDGSWAESVDLTRLVAADNEFETLDDAVFPDLDPENFNMDDDEPQGSIFGGLTMVDLHNNSLISVPLGWRRLTCLTSLNLVCTCCLPNLCRTVITDPTTLKSSNRLPNESLDVISQMSSLRDLKLASNLLTGALDDQFANLTELEILDLRGNKVSALPPGVDKMHRLRILNLSENSFEVLPFDGLSKLPLTELSARKNKLSGTLIEDTIDSLPQLQTLDVSMNQLTRLIPLGAAIALPVLHALCLSMNRLQGLPDMTTWTNLLTLTVDENSMSSIPHSFTALDKLRSADFSGNDIRVVPPEIARMENLSMIRLSGNPLRDKKFVSITTDELKEALAARLEPPPPYQEPADQAAITDLMSRVGQMDLKSSPTKTKHPKPQSPSQARARARAQPQASPADEEDYRSDAEDDDFATPPTSAHHSPTHSRSDTISSLRSRSHTLSNQVWTVKPGGILDRSRTDSSTLHPVVAARVAAEHAVNAVHLEHNLLTSLPNSLSFFAATLSSLSLAHNQLVGETYLTEELDLPALKEINLSSNRITSLEPLTRLLVAPCLEKVDVALNRINSIPPSLKASFPAMTILLAANNHIVDLEPQSIRGLKIVDASSNDISHLNPQIGLLGGLGGLQRLEVMGNRFRVPRWSTLELGTEATLRWLRSRVPVVDMAAWKKENGEDDSAEVD